MLTHIAQLLDPLGGDQLPAITAFTVVNLTYAEAMAVGAERAGLFARLSSSQNAVRCHNSLQPLPRACLALAQPSSARVDVRLNDCDGVDLVLGAAAPVSALIARQLPPTIARMIVTARHCPGVPPCGRERLRRVRRAGDPAQFCFGSAVLGRSGCGCCTESSPPTRPPKGRP